MFEKGKIYNRREDLHRKYGGQMQGGISTPAQHDFIMLFTSTTGEQYGYRDGWTDEGYLYTGEGQKGNMEFVRGNRAIRDHKENGKSLHLFEYASMGHVEYIGEMKYKTHKFQQGEDVNGDQRQIIVFVLESTE